MSILTLRCPILHGSPSTPQHHPASAKCIGRLLSEIVVDGVQTICACTVQICTGVSDRPEISRRQHCSSQTLEIAALLERPTACPHLTPQTFKNTRGTYTLGAEQHEQILLYSQL